MSKLIKVLQALILTMAFILCSNIVVPAQACRLVKFSVKLIDDNENIIKNAVFEFFDSEHHVSAVWNKEKNLYDGSFGLCAVRDHRKNFPYRVLAEGYKSLRDALDLARADRNFTIELQREKR